MVIDESDNYSDIESMLSFSHYFHLIKNNFTYSIGLYALEEEVDENEDNESDDDHEIDQNLNQFENDSENEEEEEIEDFDDLEDDIREIVSDENQIQYAQIVQTKSNAIELQNENDADEILYFEAEDNLQNNLNIKLGSSEIGRFQCANHKLDIVGRKAVKLHPELSNICKKLNRSNARCRKVIKLSKVFRKKKCRLRLENKTRWSTFYLLLLSVKKAYDKGAFDQRIPEKCCPVSLELIETYLQILKPLYMLNVSFQSDHSTISDVIPGKNHLDLII
jgi:hypothetical protein